MDRPDIVRIGTDELAHPRVPGGTRTGNRTMKNNKGSTMQGINRVAHRLATIPSVRSLLSQTVSDALASRRQAVAPCRETRAVLTLATAVLFTFAGAPAHAGDWTGAQSSDWHEGRNWSSDTVPVDGTQDTPDVCRCRLPGRRWLQGGQLWRGPALALVGRQ